MTVVGSAARVRSMAERAGLGSDTSTAESGDCRWRSVAMTGLPAWSSASTTPALRPNVVRSCAGW